MNTQRVEKQEDDFDDLMGKSDSPKPEKTYDEENGSVVQVDTGRKKREVVIAGKPTVRNCAAFIASKHAPLVFYGGKFYRMLEGNWTNFDAAIIQEAHNKCPQGGKNVIDSLAQSMRLRQDTIYTKVVASTKDEEALFVSHFPEKVNEKEIVFSNGRLDLSSNVFYPNHNELELTKESPYVVFGPHITLPYNPQEPKSKFFERYISQIFPDEAYRRYFQRLMGTILAPHNPFRGYFVFYGPAKTGKSSLATALAYAPAGNQGYETKTEHALSHDKFEAISLANKFANISNDSYPTTRWEDWLKQYTSSRISVQAKFRDSESIMPTAKLITTCNSLNSFDNIAKSFEGRFFPFKFTNLVPDTGAADSTKFLSETFWDGHREGILYWLLEGYREFLIKGRDNDVPASWLQDKKDLLNDSNPLEEWLSENFVKNDNHFIACDDLMSQIPMEFMKKSPQTNRTLVYDSIEKVFSTKKIRSKAPEFRDKYGFKGISLKGKTNNE